MHTSSRVLVLGGSGMLGHKLLQVLAARFTVFATVQTESSRRACLRAVPATPPNQILSSVDATHFESVESVIEAVEPDVVVNCIGIVKQSEAIQSAVPGIILNALLPHQLARACAARGTRLIHFSTDCVFSGRGGAYTEGDVPDPVDFYGRSKLLGELDQASCLTLRSSIVGWELAHQRSLLGWYSAQRGKRISGYRRAIFSGLTTTVMAQLVADLIAQHPSLCGLHHVASAPISKFDLLCGLRDELGWSDIVIDPDDHVVCDRSLSAHRFQACTGWSAPSWKTMIEGLARERPAYESSRRVQ